MNKHKHYRNYMKKFMFIYYGGMDHDELTKEIKDEEMTKWMAWFDSIKDKLADGGNPFGPDGKEVSSSETKNIAADMWPAKGYTIINAENIAAATAVAKSCPAIVDEVKNAGVRVYEIMPMEH